MKCLVLTVIRNINKIVSGDLMRGILDGDAILIRDGRIAEFGWESQLDVSNAQVVIDARGTVVVPGLIDSHVHVVFGDYTPRQKTVDFIDSYLHGGITSMISAGEGVHLPGRPKNRAGVKALAIAAHYAYENFRPSDVKVHGGTVIIEPFLEEGDFEEMAHCGVWLAKYGYGGFADPSSGVSHVRWAQKHGMKVMSHSGGTSIPGSTTVSADDLLRLKPDVAGHVNGGTTALPDGDVERIVNDSEIALQMCQAGNLRSALHILRLAKERDQLHRIILGSDTPSGTGVMPLAILKMAEELASLGNIPATVALSFATGNTARIYGLRTGLIEVGREADLLIMDTPAGSVAKDALESIEIGDIPGISAIIIDGKIKTLQSRNTPKAVRIAEVTRST